MQQWKWSRYQLHVVPKLSRDLPLTTIFRKMCSASQGTELVGNSIISGSQLEATQTCDRASTTRDLLSQNARFVCCKTPRWMPTDCSRVHLRSSHSQFVIDPTRSRIFAPFWHTPRLEMQSRLSTLLYYLPHSKQMLLHSGPKPTPALASNVDAYDRLATC